MIASSGFLDILVLAATLAASIAPLILIGLFIHDAIRGRIW